MKKIFTYKNLSIIEGTIEDISKEIASQYCDLIKNKPKAVIGLATGSSPLPIYKKIIEISNERNISFSNVKSFNLDEYIGLQKRDSNQSYKNFMNENLFNFLDIDKKNIHFPNEIKGNDFSEYDRKIKESGEIDIQLLGLGVNGHIAFNEPNTSPDSKTHVTEITQSTIDANARFFDNDKSRVPTKAVTMGISTILDAKKIILIATGKNKSNAIKKISEKIVDIEWPCTHLLNHKCVEIYVDEEASSLI